jgi:alginate O-acetyltransferase complex protein AlgI
LIFNTAWFLLFFLAFYALLWLVPSPGLRFGYVLAASAVFHYHFAGAAGVRPIIVMAAVTFGAGLLLQRLPSGRARRLVFVAALLVPVGGLVFYKYRGLLASTFVGLRGGPAYSGVSLALPLAISFFTFEFVHYLTDVYKGSAPVKSPFKFAFFCIFFPSIVSGPIKRFQPFLAQVRAGIPRPDAGQVFLGAGQVLLGFFKKLVVADNAAIAIAAIEGHPGQTRASVATLLFLLSIRILFDFSGYSDIAIGLGRLIGLELPRNFRYPYAARNISDFWQRWHISLSSWIRDYIYIPLGGGRRSLPRKALNLSITMFLCGLWHGPAWHYGFWGLYHGAGLAIHGVWQQSGRGARFAETRASRWLGMVVTDLFVAFGWLLFFYPLNKVAFFSRILFFGKVAP